MLWEGREWNDDGLLKSFKKYNSIIQDCKLAIEDYEDRNGLELKEFRELNGKWKQVKLDSKLKTDNELCEFSESIINEYYYLLEKIGKERFIFYEDGTVEYKG